MVIDTATQGMHNASRPASSAKAGWILRRLLLLAAVTLAGCSVTKSVSVRQHSDHAVACQSRLASYALPRRVLTVRVERKAGNYVLQHIDTVPVADSAHIYCFEHTANPFADDTLRVYKTTIEDPIPKDTKSEFKLVTEKPTAFLQLIASKSVDHTAGIIRNLIRTAFIGLSSNPDFTDARVSLNQPTGNTLVADFQLDPFDYLEMAEVNHGLRRYGFCLVLEDYTYRESAVDISRYCDAPRRTAVDHAPTAAQLIRSMRWHVPKPTSGIFYRPRAPYRLAVYIKHRPDDRGAWKIGMLRTIEMENIMPVVSVGIDRAVFAERRAGLVFDNGTLQDVCITKGSEIGGFIDIPLDVVYGVIALPSEILRATFDDIETRRRLATAQKNLLVAQENYIKFLEDPEQSAKPPAQTTKTPALTLGANDPTAGLNDTPSSNSSPPTAGAIRGDALSPLHSICAELMAANKNSTTEEF